jgi:plasmid stabilization system protein ParE
MATVRLSKPADDALAAIVLRRRRDVGFMAARALRQRITSRIYQLRDFPEMGRPMNQSTYDDRRELIVSPYRIIYRVTNDTVTILNIFDARFSLHSDTDEDDTES